MSKVIMDLLIVGYLTVVAGWKYSLAILCLLALFLLWRKMYAMAVVVFICLLWIGISAWQFTVYFR